MKGLFCSLLFLALTLQPALTSAGTEINVSATEVVLYRDGAVVKAAARASLATGTEEFTIYGLSPYIQEDSLQVEVLPDTIEVLELKLSDTFLEKPYQEKRNQLIGALEDVKAKLAKVQASIKSTEALLETLQKKDTCNKTLRKCIKEMEPLFEKYYNKLATLSLRLARLKDQKARIEKQLQQLSPPEKTKTLKLLVHSNIATEATVKVSYYVHNAGWSPYYIFRVNPETSQVIVRYMAQLYQNTGQDWKNVRITLSTGNPFFGGSLPEPEPWVVDIYRPRPKRALLKTLQAVDRAAELQKAPSVKEELLSFSITLPERLTLLSGRTKTQKVLIDRKTVQSEIRYRAVPALTERVFLEGRLKNPFEIPMLSGPVTVFAGGTLTNRTSLTEVITPGAELKLSLGVDPSVTVKKTLKKKFTETEGLFSKEEKVRYEFELEVKNGKTIHVKLTLQDSLPVSRNEKIKVHILRPTPEEANITEEGLASWELNLQPRQRKTIPVVFTVSFPEGTKVVGLP